MFSKFIYVIACIRTSYIFIISIPLYGNTTRCLILSINNKFIHSSGWWRVVSTLWLLWVILLWTFLYRILCKHVFGSVGYMYLAVDCGSDGDANVLRNCQTFQKWLHRFAFPRAVYKDAPFLLLVSSGPLLLWSELEAISGSRSSMSPLSW